MPIPLGSYTKESIQDPYGSVISNLGLSKGWDATLRLLSNLLPNPQVPYSFGSTVTPRGSLTSIVPKWEVAPNLPPTAMIREQLQQVASSPFARETLPLVTISRPYSTLHGGDLWSLIRSYNSFLQTLSEMNPSTSAAKAVRRDLLSQAQGSNPYATVRRTPPAAMSYPSEDAVERFINYVSRMYFPSPSSPIGP